MYQTGRAGLVPGGRCKYSRHVDKKTKRVITNTVHGTESNVVFETQLGLLSARGKLPQISAH